MMGVIIDALLILRAFRFVLATLFSIFHVSTLAQVNLLSSR
jgi:hypothetical protein